MITMPGVKGKLKWKAVGDGFEVIIPERVRNNPPCKYAWVFKVSALD